MINRLLAKVQISSLSSCWQWTASYTTQGYAKFRVEDKIKEAHRVLYEYLYGAIGPLDLDHLCRNRSCINPYHLEPVTHKENLRRGEGGFKSKDKCLRGHARTADNLTYRRNCKICACERSAAWRVKNKSN